MNNLTLVYTVDVAVALRRPPRVDQWRRFRLAASDGLMAELVACQWAESTPGVVMAVESVVVDWGKGEET